MDTPNLLKGSLYPTSRVSRCSRFSACVVCKKCQNFDRHLLECNVCENRVHGPDSPPKCDHLPEGEYIPDIQHTIRFIEEMRRAPMAHPDRESQAIDPIDISNQLEKTREATDMLEKFSSMPGTSMEEQTMRAWINEETRSEIGRKL